MPSPEDLRAWAERAETLARQAGALFVKARAGGSFDMMSKGGVVREKLHSTWYFV